MSGPRSLRAACACLALVALAWLSPHAIPYCMDEFAHYQALGCATHPLTRKWSAYQDGSVFREACGAYDLRLPLTHTLLPLRAYHYIGSLPGLVFAPLWAALRDPVAARVQGALFLIAAGALLARLVGTGLLDPLLAAFVFPAYALAFVVDLGPVGLSLALLGGALLCVRSAMRAARRGAALGFAALAGLAFFLGFWTKLVFAWTLPALLLFAWFEARDEGIRTRLPVSRFVPVGLLAGGAAALPSLLLLAATDADGAPYLSILREGNFSASASLRDLGLRPFRSLSRYVYDGCYVLPRTLELPHSALDVLPALLAAGTLALAASAPNVRRFLVMAAATGLVTVLTRSVWGPHHAAFALFFVAGALSAAIQSLRQRDRRLPPALASLVLLFWLTLAARLPAAVIHADTGFGKDELWRFVTKEALDRTTVQAHTSWGTFYVALLFGDRQQISLWTPGLPVKPEMIAAVRQIAVAERRGIAVISQRPQSRLVSADVKSAFGEPVGAKAFDGWRLFEFARPRDAPSPPR